MDDFRKRSLPKYGPNSRAADAPRGVADVIQGMKARSAVYAGPRLPGNDQEPTDLAEALVALRIQHEELLVADEELRAQLEELTRVDELIVRERARTQPVFAFAPDAYVITDLNVSVTECNLAAQSLFGRDVDALIRKPLAAMVAKNYLPVLYGMAAAARDGQKKDVLLQVRQRGQTAAIATKAVVTRMGADALFWRFRLIDDLEATQLAPVAELRSAMDDAAVRTMTDALRILVLSHDADLVATFDIAAKSFNGVVEIATNVRAAVALLETFPADIVVADLWSDGELKNDIITELRMRGHRPMPLGIALSGVSAADSTYALKAGFHAFLMKPVSLDSARSTLNTTNRVLLKRSVRRARPPKP